MIYLDNSATTPVDPAVASAMEPFLSGRFANPSSIHGPGVDAAEALESARRSVAAMAGPGPWDVVFTSGGTESNALAILGSVRGRGRRIVTTSLEHPSVLRNAGRLEGSGNEVIRIPSHPSGVVADGLIAEAVDERTVLVSMMHGNNEIGTLQPVMEASRVVKARHPETLVHVDAVQTAGRLPLAAVLGDVDLVTLSAHKMNGPKGVGALLVRRGSRRPAPLYLGGEQQGGLRPGTENVPGIVGFGEAARLASIRVACQGESLDHLTEAFLEELGTCPVAEPWFRDAPRIPGHIAIRIRSLPAQPVVHAMEGRGIIVSSGSACHSRNPARSHVLDAVKMPGDCDVVRVVAGHDNTIDEMREAGRALRSVLAGLSAHA